MSINSHISKACNFKQHSITEFNCNVNRHHPFKFSTFSPHAISRPLSDFDSVWFSFCCLIRGEKYPIVLILLFITRKQSIDITPLTSVVQAFSFLFGLISQKIEMEDTIDDKYEPTNQVKKSVARGPLIITLELGINLI